MAALVTFGALFPALSFSRDIRWGEHLLVMANSEGKYGFADLEQGIFVIAPRYDSVLPFSEGLAAVMVEGRWGYINIQERMVIPPRYDEVYPFFGELASVRQGERWFFINKQGEPVPDSRFLEEKMVPGQVIREREVAGVHVGYEMLTGPGDISPKKHTLPPSDTADLLSDGIREYNRGAQNFRDGNYDVARRHFQEAQKILPDYSAGYRLSELAVQRIRRITGQ